jgi:hypothetical protein
LRQLSRPVQPEIDPDDDSHIVNKTHDAIVRAVYGNRPQQISAAAGTVREIERTIRRLQKSDEPSLRYELSPAQPGRATLRLWSEPGGSAETAAAIAPAIREVVAERIQPALAQAAHAIRAGRRRGSGSRCDYCGAMPGVTTLALYQVTSPALNGPRLLCHNHAASESAVSGARLVLA